eukprot:TRINITY_DN5200_c0_g1_i2.p1 TRINITY_DN5200_c0_g1~~TRINITY_DN5200_c0_g1_i2.p1  ORF type:complete len:225 (+),score=54.07 TRINITY_DN5200_c0_g1_i2:569-1243(+)
MEAKDGKNTTPVNSEEEYDDDEFMRIALGKNVSKKRKRMQIKDVNESPDKRRKRMLNKSKDDLPSKLNVKPAVKDDESSDSEWSGEYETQVRINTKDWKGIYKEILANSDFDAKNLNKYKTGSNQVYGEALPNFVRFLINELKITPDDVFYDIGSGLGNILFQVSAQTGCKCIGIEIRKDLHKIAKRIYNNCKERFGEANLGKVKLLHVKYNYVPYTHIYREMY